LTPHSRPLPAYEVVPSAIFSPKLGKAISKVFKARHGLCPNDLVITRAEKYHSDGDKEVDREAGDVVGLICRGRREDKEDQAATQAAPRARICLADGTEWEATPLANGGYEMVTTDSHGLSSSARWVPKKATKLKPGISPSRASPQDWEKKFNFSTISPSSRRHPIIATMSRSSIDVLDSYGMPSNAMSSAPPTPSPSTEPATPNLATLSTEPMLSTQEQIVTGEDLRTLIIVSGVWVALREGWSPSFRHSNTDEPTASSVRRSTSVRSSPSTLKHSSSVRSTSPAPSSHAKEKWLGFGSRVLRSGSILRSNRASDATAAAAVENAQSGAAKTRSRRSNSTGTVLMQRPSSSRARNAATWRPDLVALQHPLREAELPPDRATPSAEMDGPAAEVDGEGKVGSDNGRRRSTEVETDDEELSSHTSRRPPTAVPATAPPATPLPATSAVNQAPVPDRAAHVANGRSLSTDGGVDARLVEHAAAPPIAASSPRSLTPADFASVSGPSAPGSTHRESTVSARSGGAPSAERGVLTPALPSSSSLHALTPVAYPAPSPPASAPPPAPASTLRPLTPANLASVAGAAGRGDGSVARGESSGTAESSSVDYVGGKEFWTVSVEGR
ncbi:hypothetical protein LTR66_012225, partial [Elasticomyces elasticus]